MLFSYFSTLLASIQWFALVRRVVLVVVCSNFFVAWVNVDGLLNRRFSSAMFREFIDRSFKCTTTCFLSTINDRNDFGWPFHNSFFHNSVTSEKLGKNRRKILHNPKNECISVRVVWSWGFPKASVVDSDISSLPGRMTWPGWSMVAAKNEAVFIPSATPASRSSVKLKVVEIFFDNFRKDEYIL